MSRRRRRRRRRTENARETVPSCTGNDPMMSNMNLEEEPGKWTMSQLGWWIKTAGDIFGLIDSYQLER